MTTDLPTLPNDTLKRAERAHRILDAAATLIQRWGYSKTTVEDIANEANVGKGTIYLHWKTREALFRALMKREQLAMAADIQRGLASDPEGATLRGIFTQTALAVIKHPLIKAYILRDRELLGKMAQSEHNKVDYQERLLGFRTYLEFLRGHGIVREHQSIEAQVYTLSAIFTGFFIVDPLMPKEYTLPDDMLASLLGDAIHRSLESDIPISEEKIRLITDNFLGYMQHNIELAESEFNRELES